MEPEKSDETKKLEPKKSRRKVRFKDQIFYYLDRGLKVGSEHSTDSLYFFQRLLGIISAKILIVISEYFVNPFSKNRSFSFKIFLGPPRILVGLIFLIFLSISAVLLTLVGGTLSGLLGFRNVADYSTKEQFAAWMTLIVCFILAPVYLTPFWTYKISIALCYILILTGFDILYGQCGILSLGHAAFTLFGSFVTVFFFNGTFGFKVPYFISMILAAVSSFILGILLGLPSLRVKDDYLVVITLAFMLALPQFLSSHYMAAYTGLATAGLSIDQPVVPGFLHWMSQATWNYFFVGGVALFLIICAYNLLHHSQVGRAFRTIKCDVEVSTILGIPVMKYKLLAFALSAVYASVAGSLIMYLNGFISTSSYTIDDSIDYIVAAVVGGPGSILGGVFGGLFLTFEKDVTALMAKTFVGGNYLSRLFYGVLMILMVLLAPRGIAGEMSKRLKSKFTRKPKRGSSYINPPPDYDFLDMRGSSIKKD